MKAAELKALIEATCLTPAVTADPEVTCGYTCDLLSWVMAHGQEGMAWVTVQTHLNVIAVAVLMEMACVILPENITLEAEAIAKATEEELLIFSSPLSSYEICGRLAKAGVPAHA